MDGNDCQVTTWVAAQRLAWQQYDRHELLRALRGEGVPRHLDSRLARLCTIRGILHSPSFADGEAATLRGLPGHPEFTRALNARAIMSNRVPDMDPEAGPEVLPYCIWYPEVASEDTYRQLVRRYPQTRYQVARACAVAGYTQLYIQLELDGLLPEVAVAEEAREAGSDAILARIMARPALHKVMDDYARTLDLGSPQVAAPLNGDTCVLPLLARQKQEFRAPSDPDDPFGIVAMDPGFDEMMYDLTEDEGVSESVPEAAPQDLMLDLLSSPLPTHLPAGNKDLLILAAAFYGDTDRYARLRRPRALADERFCVARGIYHNPLFAVWWSRQSNPQEGQPFFMPAWDDIQKAITARFIMNNDLCRIDDAHEDRRLPYLIWYPDVADEATYRALAHRKPTMREACIRAAIYCDYRHLFDHLLALPGVEPNPYLVAEAKRSSNPHFLSALRSRAVELGIDADERTSKFSDPWKFISVRDTGFQRTSNELVGNPSLDLVFGEPIEQGAVYNGMRATAERLELFLMAPQSWRPEKDEVVELDYVDWPPGW